MTRRVSSEADRGNGAGIWALRAEDSPRVAPAAGLRGDRRNGGTHRKAAEAAIPERDTLRYVASLAAAVAHEINNPLMVIIGHAELLADKVGTQGRGQIEEILKALSRIQEIVMRMERVTRIELAEEAPYLPPMLDLIRSSEPGFPPH